MYKLPPQIHIKFLLRPNQKKNPDLDEDNVAFYRVIRSRIDLVKSRCCHKIIQFFYFIIHSDFNFSVGVCGYEKRVHVTAMQPLAMNSASKIAQT